MKVSELIEALQENNNPDDEILVFWWEKQNFNFPEDDELELTDKAWLKVSKEFDSGICCNASEEVTQWIADAVIEYSELKELQLVKETIDRLSLVLTTDKVEL